MLAFVGAPGMNARNAGWSIEIVAGARISDQIRSAWAAPRPPSVIVRPARSSRTSGGTLLSSGTGFAMRACTCSRIARASVSVSASYSCIEGIGRLRP
jgi:hypothetical protein